MFHDFLAIATAYPKFLPFESSLPWIFGVSVAVGALSLPAAFYYSRRNVNVFAISAMLFMLAFVGFMSSWLVADNASSKLKRAARNAVISSVASRVLAGDCVILKDRGQVYAVTALNSETEDITLAPTSEGACQNGKPGTVTMNIARMELMDQMVQHTLRTSTKFDSVLEAGIKL